MCIIINNNLNTNDCTTSTPLQTSPPFKNLFTDRQKIIVEKFKEFDQYFIFEKFEALLNHRIFQLKTYTSNRLVRLVIKIIRWLMDAAEHLIKRTFEHFLFFSEKKRFVELALSLKMLEIKIQTYQEDPSHFKKWSRSFYKLLEHYEEKGSKLQSHRGRKEIQQLINQLFHTLNLKVEKHMKAFEPLKSHLTTPLKEDLSVSDQIRLSNFGNNVLYDFKMFLNTYFMQPKELVSQRTREFDKRWNDSQLEEIFVKNLTPQQLDQLTFFKTELNRLKEKYS